MRRLALVAALLVVPATPAFASELDDLLERGSEASFSAEQIISCSTPDGTRDALVTLAQDSGGVRIGAQDSEVLVGSGSWALSRDGGSVSMASVQSGKSNSEPLYVVEEGDSLQYLGRPSMSYQLIRDGVLRAELVFDDETGALFQAVTYAADGTSYCERRFVSFDPAASPSSTPSDRG